MEKLETIKKEIQSVLDVNDLDRKMYLINELRFCIHELSPFKNEPVDFVKWVKNTNVVANDYNPNKVAPPEMELLEVSPSWKRMARTILRNDYYCKGLGQTQPKSEAYEKYKSIKEKRAMSIKIQ